MSTTNNNATSQELDYESFVYQFLLGVEREKAKSEKLFKMNLKDIMSWIECQKDHYPTKEEYLGFIKNEILTSPSHDNHIDWFRGEWNILLFDAFVERGLINPKELTNQELDILKFSIERRNRINHKKLTSLSHNNHIDRFSNEWKILLFDALAERGLTNVKAKDLTNEQIDILRSTIERRSRINHENILEWNQTFFSLKNFSEEQIDYLFGLDYKAMCSRLLWDGTPAPIEWNCFSTKQKNNLDFVYQFLLGVTEQNRATFREHLDETEVLSAIGVELRQVLGIDKNLNELKEALAALCEAKSLDISCKHKKDQVQKEIYQKAFPAQNTELNNPKEILRTLQEIRDILIGRDKDSTKTDNPKKP